MTSVRLGSSSVVLLEGSPCGEELMGSLLQHPGYSFPSGTRPGGGRRGENRENWPGESGGGGLVAEYKVDA